MIVLQVSSPTTKRCVEQGIMVMRWENLKEVVKDGLSIKIWDHGWIYILAQKLIEYMNLSNFIHALFYKHSLRIHSIAEKLTVQWEKRKSMITQRGENCHNGKGLGSCVLLHKVSDRAGYGLDLRTQNFYGVLRTMPKKQGRLGPHSGRGTSLLPGIFVHWAST